MGEFDRTSGYSDDLVAQTAPLTSEQEVRDQKMGELCDELGRTGWIFAGSGPGVRADDEGVISITLARPEDEEPLTRELFFALTTPQFDNDGTIMQAKNWTYLEANPDAGFTQAAMSYEGPFNQDFERAVPGMARYGELAVTGQLPPLPVPTEVDVLADQLSVLGLPR